MSYVEARIAWKIGRASGNGFWHGPLQRAYLESMLEGLNKKYGLGTHWIETRIG